MNNTNNPLFTNPLSLCYDGTNPQRKGVFIMQTIRKVLCALLTAALLCGTCAMGASAAYNTGNIVVFGNYPQSEVTDAKLKATLNRLTRDINGDVTYNNVKYRRVYRLQGTKSDACWFKHEPIRWRVLRSNGDGDVLVLSEKILDARYFHTGGDAQWINTAMRAFLNGDFYNTAFTTIEKGKIRQAQGTGDKVTLLAYDETRATANGFRNADIDAARIGKVTSYAKANDAQYNTAGESWWWLRGDVGTINYYPQSAGGVYYDGGYCICTAANDSGGVRPALRLNLAVSADNNNCDKTLIPSTKYEATFINWLLYIFFFGWTWMKK
jgi:hypothetical protein